VREKHYSWLEIYDRLRASEQADNLFAGASAGLITNVDKCVATP